MKVKELIVKLLDFDQNKDVLVHSDDGMGLSAFTVLEDVMYRKNGGGWFSVEFGSGCEQKNFVVIS